MEDLALKPRIHLNHEPRPGVSISVKNRLGELPDDSERAVDSLKGRVDGLFASDAEGWGSPRPEMLFVAELDADVVQKFSEA